MGFAEWPAGPGNGSIFRTSPHQSKVDVDAIIVGFFLLGVQEFQSHPNPSDSVNMLFFLTWVATKAPEGSRKSEQIQVSQ
jgi:hypothetical protein